MVGLVAAGEEAAQPAFAQLVGARHSLRRQATAGCVPEGCAPGHADSWGVGWFDDDGQVSLLRQTGSPVDSAFYVFATETAGRRGSLSGPARVLIGHLRKATRGVVTSENAHPIRVDYRRAGAARGTPRDTLLVAHNGTLRAPLLQTLREDLGPDRDEARSDSDTVVLAAWLGQHVAGGSADTGAALVAACEALVRRIDQAAPGRPSDAYTSLNLLIAHRAGLFALRQFSGDPAYYTLLARPGLPGEGAAWIVSAEPTDDAPGWEPLTPGGLTHFATDGNVHTTRVA